MKFYPHYCGAFEDEKITLLFIEHGYEGLGLFYTILEKLAAQEKPVNTRVLKSQLKVGKKLEKCWSFLEEIDLISTKNDQTFSKTLRNYTESLNEKRKKTSKRVSQHRENQEVVNNVTRYGDSCNAPNYNINNNNNIYRDTNVSLNDDVVGEVLSVSVEEVVIHPVEAVPKKEKKVGERSRKKSPEDYSIVTKMKMIVLEVNPKYSWVGIDGSSAKQISERIRTVGKSRTGEDTTEDQLLKFFRAMLNVKYHPDYFKGNWDLKKINSEFNAITSNMERPVSRGKIIDSAIAIKQATTELMDQGLIKTYDEFINEPFNPFGFGINK